MKLYNLKRGSFFIFPYDAEDCIYQLETIDGMYSRCYRLQDKELFHFQAWTEVIEYDKLA